MNNLLRWYCQSAMSGAQEQDEGVYASQETVFRKSDRLLCRQTGDKELFKVTNCDHLLRNKCGHHPERDRYFLGSI